VGGRPEEAPSERPGSTDAELLQAISAGSEPAFEELRARYARAVARVCGDVAGQDREDCEQEVFARIWRKAALFDPQRGSAAAWLLTLARRTALNNRADRRAPPPTQDEPIAEPPEVDAFWLEAALARLSERERTVIALAYYRDLSETAIARQLRVPLGSVKSWKRRGLNRLATMLGEESP
jgi:RNA polymerase sigma-70 factor, ECF subfamily